MLNLVLYQPDIPQNFGACLRLSACMGCMVHVIEPCGFPLDHARMRRAGMDYIDKARYVRHVNWEAFLDYKKAQDSRVASHGEPEGSAQRRGASPSKLLLLETDGEQAYTDIRFQPNDYVMLGSETSGTPQALYAQMDGTLTIPMQAGMRSLNLAMSAGMLVAEACRQMGWKFSDKAA